MLKFILCTTVLLAICSATQNTLEHSSTKLDPTTHEILSSLGLRKLSIPASHSRKRLAEEGRRHATGDSRMFVIKLPPNTNYYVNSDPVTSSGRKLPLQMTSNGKPARVYHWNIPLLQKMASKRPQARADDVLIDVENKPTWTKRSHPNSLDPLAFYVPSKKKPSFRKYFSGNGKPKSFYVIEKSKKTAQYHKLLP